MTKKRSDNCDYCPETGLNKFRFLLQSELTEDQIKGE